MFRTYERPRAPSRWGLSTAALCLALMSGETTAFAEPIGASATPAQTPTSGCVVVKDDGESFTDTSVASCHDYYPEGHACHQSPSPGLSACGLQNRMKAVDVNGVDMIINAHRGVWGLKLNDPEAATNPHFQIAKTTMGGAAENSLDGLVAAKDSGFQTVEFDVFLVREDKAGKPTSPGQVYVTHFTDYRGFTSYDGEQVVPQSGIEGAAGFLMTPPSKDTAMVSKLRLKDRDGALTNATLTPLRDFVSQAAARGVLVVLDVKFAKVLKQLRPKASQDGFENTIIGFKDAYPDPTWVPIASCKADPDDPHTRQHVVADRSSEDQTLATIAAINRELKDPSGKLRPDLRRWVIVKFPQSAIPCPSFLKTALGEDFEKLLFAPGPDAERPKWDGVPPEPNPNAPISDYTTQYIAEWMRIAPRSVAFWDTTIPSNKHWQGRPFDTFDQSGRPTRYADLMDYLFRVTGRRSAIWNIDPSGPGGRHGNFGMAWEHNPNTDTDGRGDQHANLVFSGAKHALITTDRPDVYLLLRNYIKAAAQ